MSELHVVFGTGPLGRAVMDALVARKKTVRMVNRSGKMDGAPQEVEIVAGDAYDRSFAREAAQGAVVVYQCAQPGYTQWVEHFPPLQASILDAAADAGAKLVIGENLYMYGEVAGPIHEDLPYAAKTRKGRVRAQMAKDALAAHRAGKVRVALGRASDFFGPYGLGSAMGERAIAPALKGKKASLIGNPDMPHSYTYLPDFGRALVVLGERDEALGQAWHVPNDRPDITQREFMNLVFREIGAPPQVSGMGATMMRLGGLFVPEAREGVEMMYEFEKPFVVDSSRFERTFGVRATPLAESIPATVAWYRAHAAV
jgi:nucleoside-diphosphate-sugar epimerase